MRKYAKMLLALLLLNAGFQISSTATNTYYWGYKIRYHYRYKIGITFSISDEPVSVNFSNGGEHYSCCDDAPVSCGCCFDLEDAWCKTNCIRSPKNETAIVIFP
jgi:hypothetical protein